MNGFSRSCVQMFSRCLSSYAAVGGTSTIYAVATGGLRSPLAVIRVSGPQVSHVIKEIGRFQYKFPQPRMATLRKLYDPKTNNLVDRGILLWFPGPNSYTGEDCCEFHIHGGPSVISGILKAISCLPGTRPASAGEFTKRAFLNGKMDLTQVDGLADLMAAETEMQRTQALNQMSGSLSRIYTDWRDRLAKCLANSEAFIDFGEDENIESDVMEKVVEDIGSLVNEISNHLQDRQKGQRLRDGVRVAIIGAPNSGKSSLLNKLCRRDAAIVSNIPGTTRDVIEGCVNIEGFPVIFADTAGIRVSTDCDIESEGIKRSLREIQNADLILFLVDASKLVSNRTDRLNLLEDLIPSEFMEESLFDKTILIINKLDLVPQLRINENADVLISCKTGMGMDNMLKIVRQRIADICGEPASDAPHVTQERYRVELQHCIDSLKAFLSYSETDIALRTNYLKQAINSLGNITGHVGTEEILDIIFRDFCIGK